MNIGIINLILCFLAYSFLGWILETAFKSMRDRQFVNSGFLYGPFTPIYGFGAIIVLQWLAIIDPLVLLAGPVLSLTIKVVSIIVLASLLEYCTGTLLETLFNRRWWDYSDERFQIKGRVSLKYSIFWGIMGYSLLQTIQPLIMQGLSITSIHLEYFLVISIVVFLTLDLVQRLIFLGDLQKYVFPRYLHLWRNYYNKWVYMR